MPQSTKFKEETMNVEQQLQRFKANYIQMNKCTMMDDMNFDELLMYQKYYAY